MEWLLLFVLSLIVAMALLAGQSYVTPQFAQLQSAQAGYAGNVLVTALFIFLALLVGGMLLHLVDKKAPIVPTP
jgi:hypothetical protein